MKVSLLSLAVVGTLVWQVQGQSSAVLKDQKQKVSYSFGMNLGSIWKNQDIEVDLDTLLLGIKDTMSGKKTLLTEAEANEVVRTFQTELNAKQAEKRRLLGEKNKTEGPLFLAANKQKPGVITLPSGLQYTVLTEGKGEQPKSNDTVTVNYRGSLMDGTEFDSSYRRGQPAIFGVNRVIKGWSEAIQLMRVGSKWNLVIPPELAYGESGNGVRIPPNAPLVFEVELVGCQPAQPPVVTPPVVSGTNGQVTSDIIKVPSAEDLKKGAKIEVIKKEDAEKMQKK